MLRQNLVSTKGPRQWQGIPSIERAANGRLWCAFFSGADCEPRSGNTIYLTSSADDGVTWAEPQPIVTPTLPGRAYDPCLWHDPSGRLWLFYNEANLQTADYSVWAISTPHSDGAHPHWTKPHRIELGVPFAFRLNKPTVLRDGAWLLPVTWARSIPRGGWSSAGPDRPSWFPSPAQREAGFDLQGVAISTDAGHRWALHGAVPAPEWAIECMVLERTTGALLMLIRTNSGVLWQSASADGGRTWLPETPTDIVNPGVRFFIRRLASGRVLLINTPNPKERTRLLAYVSDRDDGTGFGAGLVLDERAKVSYPDAVQAPDGTIYSVHDCDRRGPGEVVLSRFTEADLPSP